VVTFRNDISYINGSGHANLPDQSGISLSTTYPNPADGNVSTNCPADGNMSKDCAFEKITSTADTSLPPVCAATSDASTLLMESDSDAVWSCSASEVDVGTADGTNTGPGTEVRNALGGETPTVGTAPDQQYTSSSPPFPVESPALAPFISAPYSPVDEISSPGIVATAPPAIEMIKPCDSAGEFALAKAYVPSAETANEEDDEIPETDQPANAGVDLPECEVRALNPFEEEPFNPFEEEPLNPFEEESLNPFGSVDDGAEPFVRDDVPTDEENEHLQTKGACGSPLNPFDSPLTYCAITTGIALPSAESSPETISDRPGMSGSIDPLDICNDMATKYLPGRSSSNSLAPLRRRVSEAVSLEDSLVFPSLQDTMASLERSATPSKTHSMNLLSPPHNMECTKKPDNNSGMCSAPATVADIPLLLTESSFIPAPDSQEADLPPLRASNSSMSWEGFDIIDAAQMELASIIKETRS